MDSKENIATMELEEKRDAADTIRTRNGSRASTVPSLKAVRVARFAEATSVESPIEPSHRNQAPFTPLTAVGNYYQPQPQPADVGFGYLSAPSLHGNSLGVEMPLSPQTPLKSALKTPGAGPRTGGDNPLSPTFKEEEVLDLREKHTEKEQKKDLRAKIRVRIAKMILRSTNFACSLIVLGMLGTTFTIFNVTRSIPPRNNLPPWAEGTNPWAQILLLVISCVSLIFSLVIFYGYWRGGHKRAERASIWYTVFSISFFTFSIIMWGIGAGVLHGAKSNGNGQDLWGWSCKDNTRKALFQSDVSYSLICRLQNWSLVCCLIEVVVEGISILIYAITFQRYYSIMRLRKSMQQRDKARSDLYLAQLRASAPNTPGVAPYSARDGFYNPLYSARWVSNEGKDGTQVNELSAAEEGNAGTVRYLSVEPQAPKPFTLQAPPLKGTPKAPQPKAFEPATSPALPNAPFPHHELPRTVTPPGAQPTSAPPQPWNAVGEQQTYASVPIPSAYISTPPVSPTAPREQIYDAVPIPGAYSSAGPSSNIAVPQYGSVPIPAAYTR